MPRRRSAGRVDVGVEVTDVVRVPGTLQRDEPLLRSVGTRRVPVWLVGGDVVGVHRSGAQGGPCFTHGGPISFVGSHQFRAIRPL